MSANSTSTSTSADGDFETRGPAVFAVTTATLILSTIFVSTRLVCRKFIVKNISWDDKIIVLAWCIAFSLSFTIDYGVGHGLGRHDKDIAAEDWGTLRRCEYVFSVLYNPALMATKTSILIFYLRLAKNTQKVLRFASWMTLIIVNIAGTVLTFMNIFQCQPIGAAWSLWDSTSKCIPLLTEFICAAPVNIVTDLAILALPIPVLTGMRLPPRQKTILVITFGLGIFVTIVDVVRIYYLQQAITQVPTGLSDDINSKFGQREFAWNASFSLMWSAVEVNVGMTCACIPTLKPLIIKILPAMLIDPHGSGVSRDKEFSDVASNAVNTVNTTSTTRNSIAVPISSRVEAGSSPQNSSSESSSSPSSSEMRDLQSRRDTAGTWSTALTNTSARENAIYFGFVNMAKPKSMLRCSASESWKYCTMVTVLFLLWGMSYGLLNTLNNAVAFVSNMTESQTLGLTSAYFGGGYFFGPLLVGEWILRRDEHRRRRNKRKKEADGIGGFKVTFIVGLCFYGIGTIIFWPSAVTNSFGGFMLSNFVVGFGLSILETGANAFLILCGPSEYGDLRLMLAQGVQGIGSVLAGLLSQKVFFTRLEADGYTDSMTLINVQWTYLAITLVCVVLALFFYYMPLPEVSDGELKRSSEKLPVDPKKKSIGGLQLRTWTLILAVVAQWTYTAAQEGNSIFFRRLITSILPDTLDSNKNEVAGSPPHDAEANKPDELSLSVLEYLLVSHAAFAVSRFIFAAIMYKSLSHPRMPKPRTLLTISVTMSVIFALLTVVLHPKNPNHLLIPIVFFYFFEGPCWPLIFSLGLKGQGRRTKRAAAFITMGGSGPAFFPFIMHAIQQHGGTVQLSFVVVVVLQLCTGAYPLYLETIKDARKMVDPFKRPPEDDAISPETSGEISNMDEEIARRRRERMRGQSAWNCWNCWNCMGMLRKTTSNDDTVVGGGGGGGSGGGSR